MNPLIEHMLSPNTSNPTICIRSRFLSLCQCSSYFGHSIINTLACLLKVLCKKWFHVFSGPDRKGGNILGCVSLSMNLTESLVQPFKSSYMLPSTYLQPVIKKTKPISATFKLFATSPCIVFNANWSTFNVLIVFLSYLSHVWWTLFGRTRNTE